MGKVKSITHSLLEAVDYIHSNNIVHHDMNPKNIVICAADSPEQAQLIDFGDAQIVRDDQIYTDFIGSPSYMAPEKLGEHKGWQLKKADVWAIGAIAFEMFTGQRCFGGNSQREIFGKVLTGQWEWPEDCSPSDLMRDFVRKCLTSDPEERLSATKALQHTWLDPGDLTITTVNDDVI